MKQPVPKVSRRLGLAEKKVCGFESLVHLSVETATGCHRLTCGHTLSGQKSSYQNEVTSQTDTRPLCLRQQRREDERHPVTGGISRNS